MLYKKSLTEYPEVLSGADVFKYGHDLTTFRIEDLKTMLADPNLSEAERQEHQAELDKAEEDLRFTDTMLNLLYGKDKE